MQRATCKRNDYLGLWFFGDPGVENCVYSFGKSHPVEDNMLKLIFDGRIYP